MKSLPVVDIFIKIDISIINICMLVPTTVAISSFKQVNVKWLSSYECTFQDVIREQTNVVAC